MSPWNPRSLLLFSVIPIAVNIHIGPMNCGKITCEDCGYALLDCSKKCAMDCADQTLGYAEANCYGPVTSSKIECNLKNKKKSRARFTFFIEAECGDEKVKSKYHHFSLDGKSNKKVQVHLGKCKNFKSVKARWLQVSWNRPKK